MAELLVRAKKHWMDDLTQKEVDALPENRKASHEARCQIGDVVVVRPDGWPWGKCECLPDFVVVKIPGMSVDEAKKYEEKLTETVGEEIKTIRYRKYSLPKTDIENAVTAKAEKVEISKDTIESKIITKSGLASEISAAKEDKA